MSDSVFVIHGACNELLSICDNEMDALRALVLFKLIDLDAVNKQLAADNNENYHDLYSWLQAGNTMDDLTTEFLEHGSVWEYSLNAELSMTPLEIQCANKLKQKEFVVDFESGKACSVTAGFAEEAGFLAAKSFPTETVSRISEAKTMKKEREQAAR